MKLALNGQWNDVSGLIYTYPEKYTGTGVPDWAQSLPDPREVRGLFKGDYCFTIWYNSNGFYYGCTKTNTDARNGCVMLALCVGEAVPLDGRMLAEKMKSLLDFCLEKNDASEIAYVDISVKAKEIENVLTRRALPSDAFSQPNKDLAYRTYANENEMWLILENPYQPDCVGYKRVIILKESDISLDGAFAQSATQVTGAIKKTYDIRSDSDDAQASVASVMDGEKFTITYRKSGFADETVEVYAGQHSPYCSIDGNVINIKSALVAGVNFKRELVLHVIDSETKQSIRKWSYRIDGGKWFSDNAEESDGSCHILLPPSGNHKIVVSADGYAEKNVNVGLDDYGMKTVSLDPTDAPIHVRLQVGKKSPVEDVVRVKPNNRLYEPLKSLEQKTLQEKRPFFSLANLVPILVVFALAAVAGLFLGRATKKTTAPTSGNDSTLMAENANLKAEIENLKALQDPNAAFDTELISLYGKVLTLVNQKNGIDSESVKSILSSYEGGLDDKNKFKENLKALYNELNNVGNQQQENSGVNKEPGGQQGGQQVGGNSNGGSGKNTSSTKSEDQKKREDLAYFADHSDSWALNEIQSDRYKGFVKLIKEGNSSKLKGWDGEGNTKNYYNNANWETICTKLKTFYDKNHSEDEIRMVEDAIKGNVKEGVFSLTNLLNSETFKSL